MHIIREQWKNFLARVTGRVADDYGQREATVCPPEGNIIYVMHIVDEQCQNFLARLTGRVTDLVNEEPKCTWRRPDLISV